VDEETLQFYRSNAQSYADWAKAPSTRLRGFLARLPPGGSILELGCGAGNHSAVMIGEGDGRDELGRYYNYPSPEWLRTTYATAGTWDPLASDTSVIQSFDQTPADMLHLVVRKIAA
jgi:SAM-dependent methyltransferase